MMGESIGEQPVIPAKAGIQCENFGICTFWNYPYGFSISWE